ncbi:serine/threonine-protein phosphatase 6 regulatory ankyrin repeat subunit B-like [Ptychodera flava]|uniref:serine/threonine-protein phosphatase 6 regulatory ankyrin repeat subunit B-like n=1 Tax=Ptychodera flava TaxID=63121 RepID=UPI00396A61C6
MMAGQTKGHCLEIMTKGIKNRPDTVRISIGHSDKLEHQQLLEEIGKLQETNKPIYIDEKEEHFYEVVQIDQNWVHISIDGKHAAQRLFQDCRNGTFSIYLAKRIMVSYSGMIVEPIGEDFEEANNEMEEADNEEHTEYTDLNDEIIQSYEVIQVPLPQEVDSDFTEEIVQILENDFHMAGSPEEQLFDALEEGASESTITELAKKADLYTVRDGLTLLHVAACCNRPFISILLYAFTDFTRILHRKVTKQDSDHLHLTAEDIAMKLKHDHFLRELNDVQKVEDSFEEIHKAARKGDESDIRELYGNGADVNAVAKELKITPLYMACGAGKLDAVRVLIELGADVTMRSGDHGGTCLHRAAEWGHYDIVKHLITEGHFTDVDIRNVKYEHTCLHRAIVGACPRLIEFLLDKGAEINVQSKNGITPLHYAISCNEIDCVAVLLTRGADLMSTYKNDYNILHHAVQKGNPQIVKLLIQHVSRTIGSEAVKQLVNAGAELSTTDYMYLVRGTDRGKRAWHYVQVERAKYPLFIKNTNGGSLDVADYGYVIKSGWGEEPPDSVRESIGSGSISDDGAHNNVKKTYPFHLAAREGNTDIILELIKWDANVNVTDANQWTPLHFASAHGRMEAVQTLISLGAETNACDRSGYRPLYYAILNEQKVITELLTTLSLKTKGIKYKEEEVTLIKMKAEGAAPLKDKEYCKSLYCFDGSVKQ